MRKRQALKILRSEYLNHRTLTLHRARARWFLASRELKTFPPLPDKHFIFLALPAHSPEGLSLLAGVPVALLCLPERGYIYPTLCMKRANRGDLIVAFQPTGKMINGLEIIYSENIHSRVS